MGIDFGQCHFQPFQIGAVAADGQIPCQISRLRQHQQEPVLFGVFPEKRKHLFGAAAGAMEHDEQLDRFAGIQCFRNEEHRIAFTIQSHQDIQRMHAGWQWRLVGSFELEGQMSENGRRHHGKVEFMQIGRKIAFHVVKSG